MTTTIKTGFFTMETVNEILKFNSVDDAKNYLHLIVQERVGAARSDNISKATSMINKCKTTRDLALSVSNFILAHPSENLKTIR
jgi:hypothetical protein